MSAKTGERSSSLLDTSINLDEEVVRAAQVTVAAHSRDANDCAVILAALGIGKDDT